MNHNSNGLKTMQKNYLKILLAVGWMLSLSACSTLVAVPLKIELPANLREPCADLPAVDIADDEDVRIAWLTSRTNDKQVHNDCKAKAAALVKVIDGK